MTTTLRPDGPEERTAGGGRTRAYRIRVNGRDAGGLVLAADGPRPATGRVVRLAVHPPDRGRGRGTVAALAAEEILRDWGCADVGAVVPSGAATALRLAAALGWSERARTLTKPLPGGPPGGALDAGPLVRELRHADTGEATGAVRVSLAHGLPDGTGAFVHRIDVPERFRGQGNARALLLLAEDTARDAGSGRIGLTLRAGELDLARADRLLRTLGYLPAAHHVYKSLR
ncbi:GNAT family N-acetyltransferase [Streptomyces sp. NPDC049879]|uniref:GNAT family N-acetyltransferase n=1 Tax=Streptomyces sp. NPDC049879 TaxID=3365598 RepID=UPI00379B0868